VALVEALPRAEVRAIAGGLGEGALVVAPAATVAVIGSVLMVMMELRGGTLRDGLAWLDQSLRQTAALIAPGGWLYALETLGAPWARGGLDDRVRRLQLPELVERMAEAGYTAIECAYRFRDRVVVRAQPPRRAETG
jgi:hypothetical protein